MWLFELNPLCGVLFLPFSFSPPTSLTHAHAHCFPHPQVLRLCGEMVEDMGRGCAMQFLGRQLLQVCMDSRVIGW